VLLTDVVMPGGLTGPAVAAQLSALRPGLKVLFMSGYTDDGVLPPGILANGSAFLQKPFTSGALTQRLRELLQ
jgi:CheY-like chemotaxis protein